MRSFSPLYSASARGTTAQAEEFLSEIREYRDKLYCRTASDREGLNIDVQLSLRLKFTIEIRPIIVYVGVVFSFMGSYIYFLMATLKFLSLSNPVLQFYREQPQAGYRQGPNREQNYSYIPPPFQPGRTAIVFTS